jgi:hypothetical protein
LAKTPTSDAVEGASRNEILSNLTQRFDADQIEHMELPQDDGTVKILKNVAPHHYIERVLNAAGGFVSAEAVGQPVIHCYNNEPAVITQMFKYTIDHPNFKGVFTGVGAEELSDRFKWLAYKFKSAQSDAIKLALKPAGVGIDLYEDNDGVEPTAPTQVASIPVQVAPQSRQHNYAPQQVQSSPAPTLQQPAQNAGQPELLGWGKQHDKTAMPQVPGSYLQWAGGTSSQDANTGRVSFAEDNGCKNKTVLVRIRTEIARRIRAGAWDPEEGKQQPRRSFGGNNGGGGNGAFVSGGQRPQSAIPADF